LHRIANLNLTGQNHYELDNGVVVSETKTVSFRTVPVAQLDRALASGAKKGQNSNIMTYKRLGKTRLLAKKQRVQSQYSQPHRWKSVVTDLLVTF